MKLWQLGRKGDYTYDEAMSFVVCADNREEARRVASKNHGDEGAEVWLSDRKTYCWLLGIPSPRYSKRKAYIVVKDFWNA